MRARRQSPCLRPSLPREMGVAGLASPVPALYLKVGMLSRFAGRHRGTCWGSVFMIEIGGLLGLIGLALTIWAIINVVGSDASTGGKVIWIIVLLILPVFGFIAWLFIGPRSAKKAV